MAESEDADAGRSSAGEAEASAFFPVVEDIVQHPLPGYAAPTSISFRPDDGAISYLYSPDNTLSRQLYVFDPDTWQQRLLVAPPRGGVEEDSLSTAEKLRRERVRERGLGVTRYEWSKNAAAPLLMVPLPDGVYVQDSSSPELRLCVPASTSNPILDPQLSPDGASLAFVSDNELFVASTAVTHRAVCSAVSSASNGAEATDPGVSHDPDGRASASAVDDMVPHGNGALDEGSAMDWKQHPQPLQLTFGARESGTVHGLAEYIAQEEMERRNGFWWSNDSSLIAFTEVDSRAVPLFKIVHQGKSVVGAAAEEDHAYPFAGETNVGVRLGVVPATGGSVRWMDVHVGRGGSPEAEEEEYLARVMWLPDNSLAVQVQNRAQTRLKLLRLDVTTGKRECLLVEESPVWVNLHDCLTPLHKGSGAMRGSFIWASERTGFRHLYMYDGKGRCLGALTEGDGWMVEQVVGVDESSQTIFFSATLDSPLETHLYAIHWVLEDHSATPVQSSPLHTSPGALTASTPSPLSPQAQGQTQGQTQTQGQGQGQELSPGAGAGSTFASSWVATIGLRRLTQGKGRHSVILDHQLQRFVDVHDSLSSPPRVTLCSVEGGGTVLATIFEQPSPPPPQLKRLSLLPPEMVSFHTPDGTLLYGALYKPDPKVFGPPPYKTVVSVYGGPHVQTVVNSWVVTVDMRAQYLRSRGILVWKLDNRGSSRRGLAFEGAIKHKMGTVDADDQAAGLQFLFSQGLADPTRIGVYGWSYGGYLAAICLARYPSLFNCAVAGAPVTSWDGYDTYYTERYMGRPQEHKEAFERSSVMYHVGGIKGKLMLVHGMIDENVHFRHTVRLINALTSAAKEYELLVFPEERHMPRGLRDRTYMEERIFEFLHRNLQ